MRLIWEKKMDLTKEEVRERLYAYLLEKKYMRKKNNNSILFYYNGKIPHRFFQIRYKEGLLRIEGWIPKWRGKEGITTGKKVDVLGDNMQEFIDLFADVEGEERIIQTDDIQRIGGFEMLFFQETARDKTKFAWAALIFGILTDFLANMGAGFICLFPLCIVTIYLSIRGMRSSRIYVAMTGLMLGLEIVLKMVTGI